ncbi:DNA-binding transcriptional regulator, LysR family [Sphingomonas sp. NFR04]|uniref:LysR substrate-binding domain-containing protein n=1 Tax=Sphingomonas sp. NFR04 TaxID=1566283 RepID=UPI0008F3DC7E|nr:LysR substrate-binding domain-containing protein [Sphingomonas sp. NFR04]SFI90135.1 DNA-binding transcriptional regulator, LysR family [Sphingomonas sp. NFR04]
MMRTDLNNLAYFAEVVRHGGFAAAGRALREPKSKLSRRVAGLEERLGLRLIERSSRRFRVTDVGQAFYERCRAMLAEADQAEALVLQAQAEPHGRIRFSCPTGMVAPVSEVMTTFLARYPKVRLQLIASDRGVDLIEERIDVALRVRTELTSDAELTVRSLGRSVRILVAAPHLASQIASVEQLATVPTLSTNDEHDVVEWNLTTDEGAKQTVQVEPRMGCTDMDQLLKVALAGHGVALLPDRVCRPALNAGQLVRVLPAWHGQVGIVHLVFTTRRGLPPAVRALIDHLAQSFPPAIGVGAGHPT